MSGQPNPVSAAGGVGRVRPWLSFCTITIATCGLIHELAVMTWLWYSAHRDPTATAERAGEFYLRHLPGFRSRLPQTLGRSPVECRKGHHPSTWRRDADQSASEWAADPDGADHHLADINHLGATSFGFESH